METYITQFKSLSTAIQNGKPAPHKAILLLSVIDLIAQGELPDYIEGILRLLLYMAEKVNHYLYEDFDYE